MRFALPLVAALAMTSPALSQDWIHMSGKVDFNRYIAGKQWRGINGDKDKGVLKRNGTWSATLNGKRASGTWVWVDSFWCRSGKIGGQELKTDCVVLHATKKYMSLTRNRGKGANTIYEFVNTSDGY